VKYKTMMTISIWLKRITYIVGALIVLYGFFVGIIGIGPDGLIGFDLVRLYAIFVMLLGVMYFIPNERICKSKKFFYLFIVMYSIPIAGMLIAMAYTYTHEANYRTWAGIEYLFPAIIMVCAPVSIILYRKSTGSES